MLKVISKAWSYAFKVMDGDESVAEALSASNTRIIAIRCARSHRFGVSWKQDDYSEG